MADINIRKAISYGIDRHKITEEVYLGHATVTDVPVHPNSYMYNEDVQVIGYDLFKAREALQKTSLLKSDTGEFDEEKKITLQLLVNEDNPQRVRTAEIVSNQLADIGIQVEIMKTEWEEYERRLAEKRYDLVIGGWKFSIVPDLRFALHSNYLNSTNFIGYSNPEMDRLLDEAAITKTKNERTQKFKLIQEKFVNDLPYLSLFYKNGAVIVKNRIKGDVLPNYFNIYNNIEKWHVLEK